MEELENAQCTTVNCAQKFPPGGRQVWSGTWRESNLPVVYNFIEFGEISGHTVCGLDMTAAREEEKSGLPIVYYEANQFTYLRIHRGGLYGW